MSFRSSPCIGVIEVEELWTALVSGVSAVSPFLPPLKALFALSAPSALHKKPLMNELNLVELLPLSDDIYVLLVTIKAP